MGCRRELHIMLNTLKYIYLLLFFLKVGDDHHIGDRKKNYSKREYTSLYLYF